MRRDKHNDVWTEHDNDCLLALHAAMGNDWKGIASRLRSRTGNQTKNQFFNVIRVLIRRAFKHCFEHREQVAISAIRPSLLSDLVRMPASAFRPRNSNIPSVSVRQFLTDLACLKFDDSHQLMDAQKTMINIKTWLLARRCAHKSGLFRERPRGRRSVEEAKRHLDGNLRHPGGEC